MIAVISFLIILFLSLLIVRVATVALVHTGLSREMAKFQARSAFTGTGFTTREAESVVNHPVRRRIVATLMLLQSAGLITATSSLILSFVELKGSNEGLTRMAWIGGGLLSLWMLARSHWVEQHLGQIIEWALGRWTRLEAHDYQGLLHLADDYRVTEIAVEEGDWLAEKSISELGLPEEGCLVLGVQRAGGDYIGAPQAETTIHDGDIMILYGKRNHLKELGKRRKDQAGEASRQRAVSEQRRLVQRQQEEDSRQEKRRSESDEN